MKSPEKVYLVDGKVFLEIVDGYLMYIGDEKFVRSLSATELKVLVDSTMLAIKKGKVEEIDFIHIQPGTTVH